MQRSELDGLMAFLKVAERRSFTAAARDLGVTPSAISQTIRALEERAGPPLEITVGTLYPVLYRLEKGGLVEPYWETQERGVPRKYYRITEPGRRDLERLRGEWQAFASAVSHLIDKGASHA